ncbi:MAG TPA: PilZ domain-containing protein [Planctomycetota bacterium]|nr:PilZ domain-containing protein [Planctomycetota bacterium]
MPSNQSFGPDRRQSPRVDTDLYGSVDAGGRELRCRVINLSRVGACALANRELPEMASVRMRLSARNDDGALEEATVEAAVVRCQRRADGLYDLGLFFTRIAEAHLAILDRVIAAHAPVAAG